MKVVSDLGLVFVNYNTSAQIVDCLRSFDNQEYHVVVVDNASPNDRVESIGDVFPNVNIIKSEKNSGFGHGCNLGASWLIDNCHVKYVFFINPDTRLSNETIKSLLAEFSDSEVGAVTPRIITDSVEPTLWYGGGRVNWIKGSATVPGYGGKCDEGLATVKREVTFASGCALMVRSELHLQIGGFDSRYFMYEEDVDYSLKLVASSRSILYVPQAVVVHSCQGSLLENSSNAKQGLLSYNNPKLLFYLKNIVYNRWLTVKTHANWLQFFLYITLGSVWWSRHVAIYLVRGKFQAVSLFMSTWLYGLLGIELR